jgi:GTPase SAR1 family protein
MFDAYLKNRINIIESLAKLENIAANERVKTAAQLISKKLNDDVFSLVVVGQFKRGKTTFINALLGEDLLPTAIIPLTSIITVLRYGDKLRITAFFENEAKKEIARDDLPLYITEKYNPKNEKGVNRVEITYPSQYLKNGVQIVDTPGIGSVFEHNTKTTYEYLSRADACIFLVAVDPPITQAELDFLRDLKNLDIRTFFVQSKIDTIGITDRDESLTFTRNIIEKETDYGNVEIFPLSGKEALEGKLSNNYQTLEKSGLMNFERSLEKFLVDEKSRVLLKSAAEKTKRLINEEMLFLEIEEKSSKLPLDELENKIITFKKFIEDSSQEKKDGERLLAEEVKELQEKILKEDINKLMVKKTKYLLEKVEEFAVKYKNENNAKFAELINEFLDIEIKRMFREWRAEEENILKKHLEEIFKRFLNRMNKIIEQIMHSSAELFGIFCQHIQILLVIPSEIEFRFDTIDDSGALSMIIDLVIKILPKKLGHKFIIKDARQKARMLVGRHCAKADYDFSMRMEKLVHNYRIDMTKMIGAIQADVLKALEAGIASKQKAAFKTEDIERRLREKIEILTKIKDSLQIQEL